MDEAQHLADRVAVMNRGRIVAEGSPDEIGGRSRGTAVVRFALPPGSAAADLPVPFAAGAVREGVVETETADVTADLHRLTAWAVERGADLAGLTVTRPSLEDVYLALTDGDADG